MWPHKFISRIIRPKIIKPVIIRAIIRIAPELPSDLHQWSV